MDEPVPQPTVSPQAASASKMKPLPIVLKVLFLVIYTLVLFFLFNLYQTRNQKQIVPPALKSAQKMVSEDQLPFGWLIMQNPIVYQWRGSVEGLMTEKTKDTITLIKDGMKIVIPVDPKETAFFDPRTGKTSKGIKSTTVDNIPLKSYLRGEFYVTPIAGDKNKIAGASFEIVVEKSK